MVRVLADGLGTYSLSGNRKGLSQIGLEQEPPWNHGTFRRLDGGIFARARTRLHASEGQTTCAVRVPRSTRVCAPRRLLQYGSYIGLPRSWVIGSPVQGPRVSHSTNGFRNVVRRRSSRRAQESAAALCRALERADAPPPPVEQKKAAAAAATDKK